MHVKVVYSFIRSKMEKQGRIEKGAVVNEVLSRLRTSQNISSEGYEENFVKIHFFFAPRTLPSDTSQANTKEERTPIQKKACTLAVMGTMRDKWRRLAYAITPKRSEPVS